MDEASSSRGVKGNVTQVIIGRLAITGIKGGIAFRDRIMPNLQTMEANRRIELHALIQWVKADLKNKCYKNSINESAPAAASVWGYKSSLC